MRILPKNQILKEAECMLEGLQARMPLIDLETASKIMDVPAKNVIQKEMKLKIIRELYGHMEGYEYLESYLQMRYLMKLLKKYNAAQMLRQGNRYFLFMDRSLYEIGRFQLNICEKL